MYKLVVLDMDGTLLNSQREITSRVRAAITAAQRQGVHVVLASGRALEGMLSTLKELGLDGDQDYVLTHNASLMMKCACKTVLRSKVLRGKDSVELYELAKKLGVHTHAHTAKQGLITPANNKYSNVEAAINNITVNEVDFETLDPDEEILKVMFIDEQETLTAAIQKLPESLHAKYAIAQSTPNFLEFMHKDSGKGMGVAALAAHLGLTAEQVICVGDAGNDLEMIKYAGLGVAMGNATDQIKAAANYITSSNDADGVAHVFEKFVLHAG